MPHEHGNNYSIPSQVKNVTSDYAASNLFQQMYMFCVQEQREERGYIVLVRNVNHNSSSSSSSTKRKRDTGREDVKENEMERHGEMRQGLADMGEPSRKSSKVTSP